MNCEFYSSPFLNPKYEMWARQLLRAYGADVEVGNCRYRIRRPVRRIFIVNDNEYQVIWEDLCGRGHRSYVPSPEFYEQLKHLDDQQTIEAYAGANVAKWNETLGVWFEHPYSFKCLGIQIEASEAYIALRAKAITEQGERIRHRLKELGNGPIDSIVFRAVLAHELGHHYTLSNLSDRSLQTWFANADLNLQEGLATLFAVNMSSNPKAIGWIWGELANNIPCISYSMYHILRASDVTPILDQLLIKDNPSAALKEFSKYVSTQMNFGGSAFFIGDGGFNGLLFDWCRNGGTDLYCTGTVAGLGSLSKGNVVASKIGFISGRYSPEVFIAANEIDHILDYDRQNPPLNIRIIDRNTLDLRTHIMAAAKYNERADKAKYILSPFELS